VVLGAVPFGLSKISLPRVIAVMMPSRYPVTSILGVCVCVCQCGDISTAAQRKRDTETYTETYKQRDGRTEAVLECLRPSRKTTSVTSPAVIVFPSCCQSVCLSCCVAVP